MNAQELIDTARTLVSDDKRLPALDESNPTCNKRFAGLGIPQTEEARRAYRELIVTTPRLGVLSIVMGNAGAEVQRCPRHVTTSNEGLANAVDWFIPGTRPAPSASHGHG